MNESRPINTPVMREERFAWVTRNKKIITPIAIGAFLLVAYWFHHSNANSTQTYEKRQAEIQRKMEEKKKSREKARQDGNDITREKGDTDTSHKMTQAPAPTPEQRLRERIREAQADLRFNSMFKMNVTDYKQESPLVPASTHPPTKEATPEPSAVETDGQDEDGPIESIDCKGRPGYLLPEGTYLEGVLLNRLDGEAGGAVDVQLRAPKYFPQTKILLLPAGTRFLGEAKPVMAMGQRRLSIGFHRALRYSKDDPFGTCSIPIKAPGLDQQGSTGVGGKVNNHLLSSLLIGGAVGLVSGLAQIGNSYGGYGYDPSVEMRNGVSRGVGQEAIQVLSQLLNRMPAVIIPQGTRVIIRLISDLWLPAYEEVLNG